MGMPRRDYLFTYIELGRHSHCGRHHSLGQDPALCEWRKSWTLGSTHPLCFLTVDAMWVAVSSFCLLSHLPSLLNWMEEQTLCLLSQFRQGMVSQQEEKKLRLIANKGTTPELIGKAESLWFHLPILWTGLARSRNQHQSTRSTDMMPII